MMRRLLTLPAIAIAVAATAAGAVGLGPLTKEGVIDGPKEAFFLTLYNPYEVPTDYIAYAISAGGEEPQERVQVLPAEARLGGHSSRQILVIANGLIAGETYSFRVCAQRKHPPEGMAINARVCSKLSARRVSQPSDSGGRVRLD